MTDEKIDIWEDFSGGSATYPAPNKIAVNQSPSNRNVWIEKNALSKRRQIIVKTPVMTDLSYDGLEWYGNVLENFAIGLNEYLISGARARQDATASLYTGRSLLTFDNSAWTLQKVSVGGTVATSTGSATITGTGTAFLTTAKAGAFFMLNEDADDGSSTIALRVISAVNSDTDITLTGTYPSNKSGKAYTIMARFPLENRIAFAAMNSTLYACAPGVTTVGWDGTNQTWNTAFPAANFAIVFKNYIFAANTTANPSRMAWSTLKTPGTWPASNFVDVSPNDGQLIVGIYDVGPSILVLKTHSAYVLTGDVFDPANPTYTLTRVVTPPDFDINTSSSIQPWKGGFIMLGRYGMYFYDGTSISKLLQYQSCLDQFKNLTWLYPDGTTDDAYPKSEPRSLIVDGRYWCCALNSVDYQSNDGDGDNTKNVIIVLDDAGAYWTFVTNNSSAGLNDGVIRGVQAIAYYKGTLYGVQSWSAFAASAGDSFVQLDTTSGSETINGTWTSKVFEFSNQQRFGQVSVYLKKQSAGNLTFEYSVDEGSFTSTTIDMTSGTGTRIKSAPIIIGRVGRSIQFRLSNAVAAQLMEIYAIELHHRELRR